MNTDRSGRRQSQERRRSAQHRTSPRRIHWLRTTRSGSRALRAATINSELTIRMNERASAVRIPLSSSGKALGTTTSQNTRNLLGAHAPCGPHKRLVAATRAIERADRHRQHAAQENQQNFRPVTEAEPDHRDGDQCGFRHRIKHLDQGAKHRVDGSPPCHRDPERRADHDGQRRPMARDKGRPWRWSAIRHMSSYRTTRQPMTAAAARSVETNRTARRFPASAKRSSGR